MVRNYTGRARLCTRVNPVEILPMMILVRIVSDGCKAFSALKQQKGRAVTVELPAKSLRTKVPRARQALAAFPECRIVHLTDKSQHCRMCTTWHCACTIRGQVRSDDPETHKQIFWR